MCFAVYHRWGPHLEFCEDCCNIWSTQREEGVLNLLKGVKASIHLGSNLSLSSRHLLVNILSFRNKLLQLLHLLPQLSPHNLDKIKFEIEASTFHNSSLVQQVKLELKTKPVTYLYTLSVNPTALQWFSLKHPNPKQETKPHAVPAAPEEAPCFEAASESQWLFGGNAPYSPPGPQSHSGWS